MRILLLFLVLVIGLTGCRSPRQFGADERARERSLQQQQEIERQRRLTEERQRTQLLVEDTELQIGDLRREVTQLSTDLTVKADNRDLQELEQRLAAVEQQLQALEARRERDRQEIIDALSRRMAELIAQQNTTRRTPGRTHVVQQGDTLSAIAVAYGINVQELMRVNNISNANALRIGKELTIPGN